jgi:hypothetical protein
MKKILKKFKTIWKIISKDYYEERRREIINYGKKLL